MALEEHGEAYDHAFSSAKTELGQIVDRMEALRARSLQLQGIVQALRPIAFEDGNSDGLSQQAQASAGEADRRKGSVTNLQSRLNRALSKNAAV